MILLANGCSWTAGGGLDNWITDREALEQVTWPKHLAELMNADDFVNLAEGCGSNQRMFRTTLEYLLNTEEHDITAVIQFTEESRYEYYFPLDISDDYENISERWMKAKTENLTPQMPEMERMYDDHYNISQQRIKYHNSGIQNITTYIERCEAFASMFDRHNITYYFWDMQDAPYRFPEPYKKYLLESFNWLQLNSNGQWDFWKYERIDEFDCHPSINGHKQLADNIFNAIKKDL